MADKIVATDPDNVLYASSNRSGVFWTSPTVGYFIYSDSGDDLVYRKTNDGGNNWGSKNVLVTGFILSFDCWADWQTVGDAGTKINIAYIDIASNDVLYVYLDTNDDSFGIDLIEECQGTGSFQFLIDRSTHLVSITKTRGGNLAVAFRYKDSGSTVFYEFYTSPDGDTWTSKASPWEGNDDYILLFPGNEADNQYVWATFWDRSDEEISLKTFDNSGNSWSAGTSISGSMVSSTIYMQMDGAIRFSDGHLIFTAWNLYNNANADLIVWDINGEGSITAKTNVLTDSIGSFLASVFIDQKNDDIYVTYARGLVHVNVTVYYKKSTDGGGNWAVLGELVMQVNAADDMRLISCGAVKVAWGGKFQPVWFNDDFNYLYTNTDNGITITAVVPPSVGHSHGYIF